MVVLVLALRDELHGFVVQRVSFRIVAVTAAAAAFVDAPALRNAADHHEPAAADVLGQLEIGEIVLDQRA